MRKLSNKVDGWRERGHTRKRPFRVSLRCRSTALWVARRSAVLARRLDLRLKPLTWEDWIRAIARSFVVLPSSKLLLLGLLSVLLVFTRRLSLMLLLTRLETELIVLSTGERDMMHDHLGNECADIDTEVKTRLLKRKPF